MSTPDNSLPTEAELRGASLIFHEIQSQEIKEELKHGAKCVKFVVVRTQ